MIGNSDSIISKSSIALAKSIASMCSFALLLNKPNWCKITKQAQTRKREYNSNKRVRRKNTVSYVG